MKILIAFLGLIILCVSFYFAYDYWKNLKYVSLKNYLIVSVLIIPILFGIYLMAADNIF